MVYIRLLMRQIEGDVQKLLINNKKLVKYYAVQMGCKACKLGNEQEESAYVLNGKVYKDSNTVNEGLLTSNDKQIWLDNLSEPNQPDPKFWENSSQITHSCFGQIKKDTARSFPTCQFFFSKTNMDRFELLLKKLAIYFPKVGYTQGINFLAGYILIAGFDNENAFKVLVRMALHQKLMIIGLYEDKFPLNRLYCALFWKLLEKRQHSTAIKIKFANVLDQIWIFQWFMTFFLYSFPVEFVKKFFDYIICKKEFALVTLALGIVNCLKADINNMKDPDQFDFFEFLDNLKNIQFCQSKISIEKVISYANSVTKHEITKALEEIKLPNNIYYTYFRRQAQRNQIWNEINDKFTYERRMFQCDPRSSQYIRDLNSIEHLERLLLRKSRLYRSRTDSRFSSQIRTSNFTVDIDNPLEIMSDKIDNQRPSSLSLPFYQQYGGIRQQVDARLQRQSQARYRQPAYYSSNKAAEMFFGIMSKEDSTSMSKDSRNRIGRNL